MFNPGKGVYTVIYRYNLFLFENPTHNIQEYLNRDTFLVLLRQNFTEDQTSMILHKLEDNEKLLIDFEKLKVNIVTNKKPQDFAQVAMQNYLSMDAIVADYENKKYEEFPWQV